MIGEQLHLQEINFEKSASTWWKIIGDPNKDEDDQISVITDIDELQVSNLGHGYQEIHLVHLKQFSLVLNSIKFVQHAGLSFLTSS